MVFSSMGGVSATMTNDTKVIATNYSSNVLYNPTIKEIQNAIDSSDDGEDIVIKGSPTDNGLIKSKKNFNIEGENCTFNNIRWKSTKNISFRNINFNSNKCDCGGAIRSEGSVNCINCNFTGNSATYTDGGAISSDLNVMVSDCNFVENSASDRGGAISSDGDVSVYRCSFNKNKASGATLIQTKGGAIYSRGYV